MSEPFGSFVLERLLGRGGMAEAYKAFARADDAEQEPLVLKRIRPDYAKSEEYLRRFVLEAQVASRLSHDNLARFREFGKVGRCHYIVMDMVRGHSLHRLLDPVFEGSGAPPVAAALSILVGILDGLAAMHAVKDEQGRSRPMLHRDVTPSNVIVGEDGAPVIIDFGITKDVMGPAITLPGRVIGTARYMSPEHRKAEFIDPRADVFSASVIAFELLFGRRPWPPLSTMKELLRTTFDPPEITDEMAARVPRPIIEVILRGLHENPEQRFADATEMAVALRACEAFPKLSDHGREAVVDWVGGLDMPIDESLSRPVLDLADATTDEAEVFWTSAGALSTDELRPEDPTIPPAEPLVVPPLPPPRAAALADGDEAFEDQVADALGGSALPRALVIVAALVVCGGLGWLLLSS